MSSTRDARPDAEADPKRLRGRVAELPAGERGRLRRRIDGTRKIRDPEAKRSTLRTIAADVRAAEQRAATGDGAAGDGAGERRTESDHGAADRAAAHRAAARRRALPEISYPDALPISAKREEIAAAIRDNQVVVLAGETGSGKTTQLPKICLELGRGTHGRIGHTQPRRIAARSVAERLATELGTEVGDVVGWKVRFTNRVTETSLVKVATDGILLAEIQHDPMLRAYDTLIIDEAHERSLNIDFLLGYLTRLLPRRPDLKLVITSATIDPERFARHFAGKAGPAPVIEVSGRTYPVEVRYRPLSDPDDPDRDPDRDQVTAISDAVDELAAEGPGDMLVFLSGEREIRDTAEALEARRLPETEILPLYARLSAAEQQRVFQPHRGRRIVLATNVAETSLTVPGITYVIDPGTARISRYSKRLKVQRLPIERISQASAEQRAGRCGRIAPGICVRLYSESDFASRPRFTDPEILRTNLASVILQMTAARLGDIGEFPFLDPPQRQQITEGLRLLVELGALRRDRSAARGGQSGHTLTRTGRTLAGLPVDPRLARMVLEAEQHGCAHQVIVIAAALSIQDPRERPAEQRETADSSHARFTDHNSDFLSYLNLWDYLGAAQRELSGSKFRKRCRAEFISYLRLREWQDIYHQLRETAEAHDIDTARHAVSYEDPQGAGYQEIHMSLLAGLLSHIGLRDVDARDYLGARGARFAIFPGSGLFSAKPHWVMAAELVETTRLWARVVARIQPEWIERLAGDLLRRSYAEPHWARRSAAVLAYETVSLYGVPLVAGRKVTYGTIDPEYSRELFIRHALVEGDWDTEHRFLHDNAARLAEAGELEHRARRTDLLVDDETLVEFYDRRLGEEVVSGAHFDSWWKRVAPEQPELLDFPVSMLADATEVSDKDYPPSWSRGSLELAVTYHFAAGSEDSAGSPGEPVDSSADPNEPAPADGVTVHVPLVALNQVADAGTADFDWQVPGMRTELITQLLKSLPKPLRRQLVPVPDTAREIAGRVEPYTEPLTRALGREIESAYGVAVPAEAWDYTKVPEHLTITFRVRDGSDGVLAEGTDLPALRARLAPRLRAEISRAAVGLERSGLREWSVGELPESFEREGVRGFPALVDAGEAVDVRVFPSPAEQRRAMAEGTRKLVLLGAGSPVKALRRTLSNTAKLELAQNPHGSLDGLLHDCLRAAADAVIAEAGGPAWGPGEFAALRETVQAKLAPALAEAVERVRKVLAVWHRVDQAVRELAERTGEGRVPGLEKAVHDLTEQLSSVVYDGFITDTGIGRLADVQRYLLAAEHRVARLPEDLPRDLERTRIVRELAAEHTELRARTGADEGAGEGDADAPEIGWMLEELRVSFFAQQLGTAYPISETRVRRALDRLDAK